LGKRIVVENLENRSPPAEYQSKATVVGMAGGVDRGTKHQKIRAVSFIWLKISSRMCTSMLSENFDQYEHEEDESDPTTGHALV